MYWGAWAGCPSGSRLRVPRGGYGLQGKHILFIFIQLAFRNFSFLSLPHRLQHCCCGQGVGWCDTVIECTAWVAGWPCGLTVPEQLHYLPFSLMNLPAGGSLKKKPLLLVYREVVRS